MLSIKRDCSSMSGRDLGMILMAFQETGFDVFLFGVLMRICSLCKLFSVKEQIHL